MVDAETYIETPDAIDSHPCNPDFLEVRVISDTYEVVCTACDEIVFDGEVPIQDYFNRKLNN